MRNRRLSRWRMMLMAASLLRVLTFEACAFAADAVASPATVSTRPAVPTAKRHQPTARRHAHESAMDARIAGLAKALNLDPAQQAEVRKVLEKQRTLTRQAWSDPSVPAALRVKATQNIAARATDEIRALLNDEQRKKYIQPHAGGVQVGNGVNVEDWMKSHRAN